VDLKEKKIFFYKTKNGSDHELPLAPMALRLLQMRQEQLAEEFENNPPDKGHSPIRRKFVFPAQNKTSKTGCYTDPTEMLASVMRDAGIEKVTPHDLRRSFGRVAESLNINESMISKLLNHGAGSVTRRYTEAEWRRLSETMERIEQAILSNAPRVYNALRPLNSAPMPDDGWVGKPYRKSKTSASTPALTTV
jgi:integrase